MSLTDARIHPPAERLPAGLLKGVVAYLNPIKIFVFGSQAIGNAHKDSDWDLLIVVDDEIPAERIKNIQEARRGIRGAIDLIPFRESTFRDRVDIIGSLPWTAATKGIVVYERAAAS